MTLIEFLSLDLRHGDKVSVTIRIPARKTSQKIVVEEAKLQTEEYFFAFLENPTYGTDIRFPDNLNVVLLFPDKEGRMSARSNKYVISLEYIVTIDPVALHGPRIISPDAARSLCRARDLNYERCRRQAEALIKEMDMLFPDKAIIFPPEQRASGDYSGPNFYATGTVASVHVVDGEPMYQLQLECEDMETAKPYIPSWSWFLHLLMEAISDPYLPNDEEDQDDFDTRYPEPFVTKDTDWRKVPDVIGLDGVYPVLHATRILKTAKANLMAREQGRYGTPEWLALPDNEKREELNIAIYQKR